MTHNELADEICLRLRSRGEGFTLDDVRDAIHICLKNVQLVEESTELVTVDQDRRGFLMARFLACKTVEGCSAKTIDFYKRTLIDFMGCVQKQFDEVKADDVRYFLACCAKRGAGKTTMDNYRRNLASFYKWATVNEWVQKNPLLQIKAIKQDKRVKRPFSDVEVEMLRVAAQGDLRTTAIIEVLLSTGMRIGELQKCSRDSLRGDEFTVFGKGAKERVCYLNARATVAIDLYLKARDDDDPALIVGDRKPHHRISNGALERAIHALGEKAEVPDCHPHRFRRTAATTALNRGMPLDQVQQLLGHESMQTTLIYAKAADTIVKQQHKRLM